MKRLCQLILVLGLVVATVPALALDLGGHDRDGVVVGLNLGAGWNKLKYDSDVGPIETDTRVDFSGGLTVGWAPNDHVIGSIGFYGWKEGYNYDYYQTTARTYSFLAEVAWFPLGEGFWLKGGIGRGILDFHRTTLVASKTIQHGGLTWVAGVGYEFRVSDQAAIGVAFDYRYLTIDQFEDFTNVKLPSKNLFLSMRFYI